MVSKHLPDSRWERLGGRWCPICAPGDYVTRVAGCQPDCSDYRWRCGVTLQSLQQRPYGSADQAVRLSLGQLINFAGHYFPCHHLLARAGGSGLSVFCLHVSWRRRTRWLGGGGGGVVMEAAMAVLAFWRRRYRRRWCRRRLVSPVLVAGYQFSVVSEDRRIKNWKLFTDNHN